MTAIAEFHRLVSDLDGSLAAIARRPDVAREIGHYLARIRSIGSVAEVLSDDRVYRFALKAFDLHEMGLGKSFVGAVLAAGSGGRAGFALELSSPALRELAAAFDFTHRGAAAMTQNGMRRAVVDRYLRVEFEETVGRSDRSLQLALYFQRRAPQVAGVHGLMADPQLWAVVRTGLALPSMPAPAEVEKQAKLNGLAVGADNLMDSAAVEGFVGLFLERWRGSGTSDALSSPMVGLGHAGLAALSLPAIACLQDLKPGGGN